MLGTTASALAPEPARPLPETAFQAFVAPTVEAGGDPALVPFSRPAPPAPIGDFPRVLAPTPRPPRVVQQTPQRIVIPTWRYDPEVSWYGPGFYGQRTACGQALTTSLIGVANRTLPCGTLVAFRWGGRIVRARVVDRGPYVSGRQWDLTGGLCQALRHCFTGPIDWRLV